MTPEQERALALARARQRAAGTASPEFSGSVLPFSKDAAGNVSFDSNAGILGALKRSFMLPGDVMAGKVDPSSLEGIERAAEFALTVSPVNPAVRSGERVIPGALRSKFSQNVAEVPSAEELKAAGAQGFNAMRDTGVDYSVDAVRQMALETKAKLDADGLIAKVAPNAHAILDELASPPEGSVANIAGLHAARKAFGKAAQNFNNPADQEAASRAIRGLDGFIEAGDPASAVAGTPAEAGRLLREANANYAAGMRSGDLASLQEAAELRAASANSGQNVGNTTRQRLASYLLNDKQSSGYSDIERELLEGVIRGDRLTNATRTAGNILGGGGGLGALLTGGAGSIPGLALGSPELSAAGAVALPAIGRGLKEVSNALTEKALNAASSEVRKRSPLYESRAAEAGMSVEPPDSTAAIIRLLLLSGQGSGGGW